MPQLNGADGDDLGANDELIAFKDEGEQEEKRNVSAGRDLDDVKSSLVNESETNSSSDSEVSEPGPAVLCNFSPLCGGFPVERDCVCPQPPRCCLSACLSALFTFLCVVSVQADRRPKPDPELDRRARHSQLFEEGEELSALPLCWRLCVGFMAVRVNSAFPPESKGPQRLTAKLDFCWTRGFSGGPAAGLDV